jgi:hypothetical protein
MGGSSAGISNFKRIFNHRKGHEKTRETLPLKEKLSFGRGQGQVGLYGGLMRVLRLEKAIIY